MPSQSRKILKKKLVSQESTSPTQQNLNSNARSHRKDFDPVSPSLIQPHAIQEVKSTVDYKQYNFSMPLNFASYVQQNSVPTMYPTAMQSYQFAMPPPIASTNGTAFPYYSQGIGMPYMMGVPPPSSAAPPQIFQHQRIILPGLKTHHISQPAGEIASGVSCGYKQISVQDLFNVLPPTIPPATSQNLRQSKTSVKNSQCQKKQPMKNQLQKSTSTAHNRVITNRGPKMTQTECRFKHPPFEEYWSNEQIVAARANPLNSHLLIEGSLRINKNNYEEAYISNPTGENDILVYGSKDRNRAFHGDLVLVKIKPKQFWIVREAAYSAYKNLHNFGCNNPVKKPVKPEGILIHSTDDSDQSFDNGAVSGKRFDGKPHRNVNRYTHDELASIWYQMKRTEITKPDSDVYSIIDYLDIARPHGTDNVPTSYASHGRHSPFERPPPQAFENDEDPPPSQPVKGKNEREFNTIRDYPNESIPDEFLQPVAQVVCILQMKNSRAAVGKIRPTTDGKRNYVFFVPSDNRVPRMLIPASSIDPKFFDRPQDYKKFLYIARLVEWPAHSLRPKAELYRSLGNAGEIEPETEGLLLQYDIDTREFSQAVINCLPHVTEEHPWTIPDTEIRHRRDLRRETVITIDPATARDLDDALHIKEIAPDLYEVGVHIADVSFFIREGSELDQWAKRRANSTYLVHKVIPMLPRLLCEELCSLNSGVDRLTFSVIWHIRGSTGEIEHEWMGRTIINSCCTLTYEHAQGFLNEPDRHWEPNELSTIYNERQTDELSKNVNLLWYIAKILKEKRYQDGSLRLNMPKLQFTLDLETGFPTGVSRFEAKESNMLVEEMMILANRRIAETIAKRYPELALLRRHSPPDPKQMREVMEICESLGYPLEGSSSSQLEHTLKKYCMNPGKPDDIFFVLQQLLIKPMQLAQYFCTGVVESEAVYRHYALAMDYYTHFTSPIRRYPDVIVHRLLAAHCGYSPLPATLSKQHCQEICDISNDRKLASKTVSEASAEMFFAIFVQKCGPIEEKAIVMNVLDHSFDVLLVRFGTVKRVYCDKLSICGWEYNDDALKTLDLFWSKSGAESSTIDRFKQTIKLTTQVDAILTSLPDEPLQYRVTLKSPTGAIATATQHCDHTN